MYWEDRQRPGDSWRNCLSYLIELHDGIRAVVSRRWPDWTLTSSPVVFRVEERVEIVEGLLAALAHDNAYLLLHPTIRVIDLARFVTSEQMPRLRASVESPDSAEAANAALLLAACGDRPMAARLLDLALDPSKPPLLRNSALAAFANVGEPGSVGRLLDIDDWDGATALSRTDAAAGLMDASNASLVLAALGRTNATVSSAYYRFGELSVSTPTENLTVPPGENLTDRRGDEPYAVGTS